MHLGFHIYDVGFQSPNVEAARPGLRHLLPAGDGDRRPQPDRRYQPHLRENSGRWNINPAKTEQTGRVFPQPAAIMAAGKTFLPPTEFEVNDDQRNTDYRPRTPPPTCST